MSRLIGARVLVPASPDGDGDELAEATIRAAVPDGLFVNQRFRRRAKVFYQVEYDDGRRAMFELARIVFPKAVS